MANIGYGVTLWVSDAAPAFDPINKIAAVTGFTPPTADREIIDVTSTDSPDWAREFIAGLVDHGEASFPINWDLNDATDVLLTALQTERTARTWEARFDQYTPTRKITFKAFLRAYEPDAPMEDKMTANVTLKVTGKPIKS